MRKITLILPAAAAILAAGCSLAPRYDRPQEALPSSMGPSAVADSVRLDAWWTQFNDPTLTKLVEKALAENTDLQKAYNGVKASRAALGITRADYFPSLSANSSDARKDTSDRLLTPGQPDPANLFYHYGMLSYEVDLFGRIASSNKAAREDLLGSEYGAASMKSLVAAQTAITYYNLVAAREQLAVTLKSVETRRRSLKIVEDRYAAGYGNDSERQQAVSELASAEAPLPALKKSIASLESSLRLLVGEDAAAIWNEAPIGELPQALPEPPEVSWDVTPASLLDRRPDVLSAEASLKAANARIGVARAQRLPSISISAILGTSDTKWDGLFEGPSQTWTLSGNLAAPIFDFGRSRNRVKSAKTAAEAAEINYRAVVRNAFLELRNAATAADLSRESVLARAKQDEAWTRSLAIAEERARTGYADPLELLDAERSQMAAQLALVSAKRDRLVAAVNLCRALGGGWSAAEKK